MVTHSRLTRPTKMAVPRVTLSSVRQPQSRWTAIVTASASAAQHGDEQGDSGRDDHGDPDPCLRRVQRLEAAGVIRGYRAIIDPAAMGRGFEVLLDVDLLAQDASTVERFESTLAAAGEVIELRRLFGKPGYFVRVAVADLTAYEIFLSSRVMTTTGVGRVHSRFAMKNIKGAAADL
jgi:DNA-binding Lrp family transcriptional regulator